MSGYIEVDHLKKSVEDLSDCYNGFSDTYDKACIIGLIDEEPTADVVEVVRCKDCKHSDRFANGSEADLGFPLKCLSVRYGGVRENWFCEHGEKRA